MCDTKGSPKGVEHRRRQRVHSGKQRTRVKRGGAKAKRGDAGLYNGKRRGSAGRGLYRGRAKMGAREAWTVYLARTLQ